MQIRALPVTISERVTSYGDLAFVSMLCQPLRRLTRSVPRPDGEFPYHDVSKKIVSNLCSLITRPDVQEFFLAECMSFSVMFCSDQSRTLMQEEIQAEAEVCKGLPELLSMLLTLKDENEMIFALIHSKVLPRILFSVLQRLPNRNSDFIDNDRGSLRCLAHFRAVDEAFAQNHRVERNCADTRRHLVRHSARWNPWKICDPCSRR
jgi:hypothetical protein